MILSPEDVRLFYRLHTDLLVYANRHKMDVGLTLESGRNPESFRPARGGRPEVSNVTTREQFYKLPLEAKVRIRDVLWRNRGLINSYLQENPCGFPAEELEIVQGWNHSVKDHFILFKYLREHAVFLDSGSPHRAYGVLALNQPFDEVLQLEPPVMLEAVLLPFKGRIVYDGLIQSYRVRIGPGLRRSFADAYAEAKARFGIITSLPFRTEPSDDSDIRLLKAYLKTKDSRERHWDDIERLVSENRALLAFYHQEMGRIHARSLRRRLREIGLTQGWFATLEGTIVASGVTQEQVEQNLKGILPAGKRSFAYIFPLRSKS